MPPVLAYISLGAFKAKHPNSINSSLEITDPFSQSLTDTRELEADKEQISETNDEKVLKTSILTIQEIRVNECTYKRDKSYVMRQCEKMNLLKQA